MLTIHHYLDCLESEVDKYYKELIEKGYNERDISIAIDGKYLRIFEPRSLRGTHNKVLWLRARLMKHGIKTHII